MKETLKIRRLFNELAGRASDGHIWYWNDKRADGTRRKIFKVYASYDMLAIWKEVQKSFPDWELYCSTSWSGGYVTGLYKREAI